MTMKQLEKKLNDKIQEACMNFDKAKNSTQRKRCLLEMKCYNEVKEMIKNKD